MASTISLSVAPSVAALEERILPTSHEDSDTVGYIDIICQIEISDAIIEVNSINNSACKLYERLDTGSPVSFIKGLVFSMFLDSNITHDKTDFKLFRTFNDSEVISQKETKIGLLVLPNNIPNIVCSNY